MLGRSVFLEGTGICHKCERKTAKWAWSGFHAFAEARGLGTDARWLRSELVRGAADFHLQIIALFLAQLFPCSLRQLFGGGEAVWQTWASWSGGGPTSQRTRLLRRWPACWQLCSSYWGWKALYAWSQFLCLQFILPGWSGGRLVQEARGMLAPATVRVVSGCWKKICIPGAPSHCLPPGLSALKHVLRPIPKELWQLFDVVAVLLENGWDNGRSETQIFSSRLCGSFIKNRQTSKLQPVMSMSFSSSSNSFFLF